MEVFLRCIEAVATTTNTTGFAAIKITALGRPQLLVRSIEFSKYFSSHHKQIFSAAAVRGDRPGPQVSPGGHRGEGDGDRGSRGQGDLHPGPEGGGGGGGAPRRAELPRAHDRRPEGDHQPVRLEESPGSEERHSPPGTIS